MRIAMIGQKGFPARSGGVEKHVEELSKRLAHQGHDVMVFCRSWYVGDQMAVPAGTKELLSGDGVQLVFTGCLRTKNLDAITHTFFSMIEAARRKADVFHIHGVGPALLAWLPKLLRPSAKVIVTFHCVDRHHAKWSLFARLMLRLGERLACRAPDATITVSKTLNEYCRLSYGAETTYIPNGVTVPTATPTAEAIAKFGLRENGYFLMVSRLVRHKGAHTLIAAWKQAREQRPELFQEHKLVIVGGSAFTDSYVQELRRMTEGDASILLAGEQHGETLATFFAHAYACVHPSTSEGLPIAVLEEMSWGKCVLASDIPENMELVERHGMSFQTDSVDDLSRHLIMLAEAPDQVAHVGIEAAQHVAHNYGWSEITAQTIALYERASVVPLSTRLPQRA